MSEHRRKSPLPAHGGRAAARRAAQSPTPRSYSRSTVEHAPVPPTPEPKQTQANMLSSRFFHSRIGRSVLAGSLLVGGSMLVLHEEPPKQQTQTVATTTVPHTISRTGGDGVWLHDSAGLGTPLKVVMPEGSQFNVDCFVPEQDIVNGNAVWLEGDYNGTRGAVTDYYIDTHWNTTQDLVNQGIEQCGTQPAAAPAPEQQQPEQQAPQQPTQNTTRGQDDHSPYKTIGSCRGPFWGAIQEVCVNGTMGEKDVEGSREWVELVSASSPDAGPGKLEIWGDGFYHTIDGQAEYEWKIGKWVASGTDICAAGADSNGQAERIITCYKINVEE